MKAHADRGFFSSTSMYLEWQKQRLSRLIAYPAVPCLDVCSLMYLMIIMGRYIRMPGWTEWTKPGLLFFEVLGFPRVIGAVDQSRHGSSAAMVSMSLLVSAHTSRIVDDSPSSTSCHKSFSFVFCSSSRPPSFYFLHRRLCVHSATAVFLWCLDFLCWTSFKCLFVSLQTLPTQMKHIFSFHWPWRNLPRRANSSFNEGLCTFSQQNAHKPSTRHFVSTQFSTLYWYHSKPDPICNSNQAIVFHFKLFALVPWNHLTTHSQDQLHWRDISLLRYS